MVFYPGLVSQLKGLAGSVHAIRTICDVTHCLASLCANKPYTYILNLKKKEHFIFPTIKFSMNTPMEQVGFSVSNKDKDN